MKWTAILVVALAAAGCDSLFGLTAVKLQEDAPRPPDGPRPIDAPGCAGGMFVGPIVIPELRGTTTGLSGANNPTLSDDGLTIWFEARVMTSGAPLDLYDATRPDPTTMFTVQPLAAELVSSSDDADPAFTADGLDLIFRSKRSSGLPHAWEATRTSLTTAFGNVHEIVELTAFDVRSGLDLSNDGLTLYVTDYAGGNTANLYAVTRPDRLSAFDVANKLLIASATQFAAFEAPGVSPDGLELFYDDGASVWRVTRASTTVAFDNSAVLIQTTATGPDLSPDARTLVMAHANGIEYLTRTCP